MSEGGAEVGGGWTVAPVGGGGWEDEGGDGAGGCACEGAGEVDCAELRIEEVEGYCRREAPVAALLAVLDAWLPIDWT